MDEKTRKGAGLLAVAAIGGLLVLLTRSGAEDGAGAAMAIQFVGGAVLLTCGVVGLALIAVGLLRPPKSN